jgi:aldehyde dehydrogenase
MNKPEFSRTAKAPFEKRYGNFIGGKWAEPRSGRYFENFSPVNGQVLCEIARSNEQDIEAALDAAHAARDAWGRTSVAERSVILNKIADRMQENLDLLALAETWDNGKPIRETTAADLPLAIDHFRYFAGAIRGQEGSLSEIDHDTVAYHFHEPLGVVGQHSVELPAADGLLETGSCDCCGKLRGVEAGRANPGFHHGLDRSDRGSSAARRAQHCQRLRP